MVRFWGSAERGSPVVKSEIMHKLEAGALCDAFRAVSDVTTTTRIKQCTHKPCQKEGNAILGGNNCEDDNDMLLPFDL